MYAFIGFGVDETVPSPKSQNSEAIAPVEVLVNTKLEPKQTVVALSAKLACGFTPMVIGCVILSLQEKLLDPTNFTLYVPTAG